MSIINLCITRDDDGRQGITKRHIYAYHPTVINVCPLLCHAAWCFARRKRRKLQMVKGEIEDVWHYVRPTLNLTTNKVGIIVLWPPPEVFFFIFHLLSLFSVRECMLSYIL